MLANETFYKTTISNGAALGSLLRRLNPPPPPMIIQLSHRGERLATQHSPTIVAKKRSRPLNSPEDSDSSNPPPPALSALRFRCVAVESRVGPVELELDPSPTPLPPSRVPCRCCVMGAPRHSVSPPSAAWPRAAEEALSEE